ncbi:MAG: zf-HC2 domain-containing protein [Actinomycetota bacterium]|nr:zf-HC2 domain-containing protein [Actinomycetota bacterium]
MNDALITCRTVVELVTDYLEGGMVPDVRLSFERHVAACPPCRAFLMQMRETLRVSGKLSEESLSPDARESLLAAFRDWRSAR